jgi:hypothetical protein
MNLLIDFRNFEIPFMKTILLYDNDLVVANVLTMNTNIDSLLQSIHHGFHTFLKPLILSTSTKFINMYSILSKNMNFYFVGFVLLCGCFLAILKVLLDLFESILITKKQLEQKIISMKKKVDHFTCEHDLILKQLEILKNDVFVFKYDYENYDQCIQKIQSKVKKLEKEITTF